MCSMCFKKKDLFIIRYLLKKPNVKHKKNIK